MQFIADLHIHSHYSRATSRDCNPENLYRWAVFKGITLVGTGDFTHPEWREELKAKLEPMGDGAYRLKPEFTPDVSDVAPWAGEFPVRFVLSGEISTVYKKNGRTRKLHHLILLPDFECTERLTSRLESIGNLGSDGRPILGLDSSELLRLTLEACPEALFIPAHIWTPHFSVYGANSGFDSIDECFGELVKDIYAVETGLSSDPPMNWRLSTLDRFALVSNSDAHSPSKIGREANIFDTEPSFTAIRAALRDRDPSRFIGTIEFFPEEGKYHYDGHRACQVRWKPAETRKAGGICPVCGRRVTVGVLHRVEELADRPEGTVPPAARHFESLVPLEEIIASAIGVGVSSKRVSDVYFDLIRRLGPELVILRETPLSEIARVGSAIMSEGVRRVRAGELEILPGFDGEYGRISVFTEEDRERFARQAALFQVDRPRGATGGDKAGRGASPEVFEGTREQVATLDQEVATIDPGLSVAEVEGSRRSIFAPSPGRAFGEAQSPAQNSLNLEQLEAVTAAEGPIIVLAGPGTGKTRTLAFRVVNLLSEGVAPEAITAVTFTNRAASEMRERIGGLIGDGDGTSRVRVGTFHSICFDLLQGALRASGEREFIVLDEADSDHVLREVSGRRGTASLRRWISLMKSRGIAPGSSGPGVALGPGVAPESGIWPESGAVPEELHRIFAAYQEALERYHALDYDDILLATLRMSLRPEPLLHLLVDEFQDVNAVQYELVKLWAGDGRGLFLIGDPNQAIYGFRGADHGYFRRVSKDYPAARIVRLVCNYRSTPEILFPASKVIANNRDGTDFGLIPTKPDGPKIRYLQLSSELAEGIAIVREINRMVGGVDMLGAHGQGRRREAYGEGREGRSFSDIAVLFRTGHQGEVLEECFLKEGIPYRIVGRESFLDDEPVRELLAFLRYVLNPDDEFHALLCRRMNRLGPRLEEAAAAYRALLGEPPRDIIARWIEESSLRDARFEGDARSKDGSEAASAGATGSKPSLERLLRVSTRFGDLPSFLRGLTLAEEADFERSGLMGASAEAVTLMTLHAAKGLEFPVVFIAGVEDGLLPLKSRDSREEEGDSDANIAEERRLFYVGMTRAMDELILLSAKGRTRFGRKVAAGPSPFLGEIPEAYLERIEVMAKPRKGEAGKQLSLF